MLILVHCLCNSKYLLSHFQNVHNNINHQTAVLYIVATPIGNLEDMTLRALRILKEVDYIAAEDTRHTKKLLNHYGVNTRLISYYREQEVRRAETIIDLLDKGHSVAIVTDAGTPGISDPGSVVVQKARQKKYKIVPLPGASALTTALSCAGISDGRFLFQGFAPAKQGQRRKLLQTLVHADYYSVFYETPHRIDGFLRDAYEILGDIEVFIARELTKNYEELKFTSLKLACEATGKKKNRGEFVVILSPGGSHPDGEMDMDEMILWYKNNSSLSLKDCCKKLADDLGISRSKIYKRALQLWSASENDDTQNSQ